MEPPRLGKRRQGPSRAEAYPWEFDSVHVFIPSTRTHTRCRPAPLRIVPWDAIVVAEGSWKS